MGGAMSLSRRAQMMRTGPAKVRCWSAQASSSWGWGTLRRYLVRSRAGTFALLSYPPRRVSAQPPGSPRNVKGVTYGRIR